MVHSLYYFHKTSVRNFVCWDREMQRASPHWVPGRSRRRQNQGGRSSPIAWRKGGRNILQGTGWHQSNELTQCHSTQVNSSWNQKTLLHWFMIQLSKNYTPKGAEGEDLQGGVSINTILWKEGTTKASDCTKSLCWQRISETKTMLCRNS